MKSAARLCRTRTARPLSSPRPPPGCWTPACPARRLPPDPAATTLFQLRETRLLQPLWLYVETEAVAGGGRQCSAAPQQSEEDRLVFVRERVGEQLQWVGSLVLPATAGQAELQNKVQQLFPAGAALEWEQPDGAGQETAECGETGLVCLVRRMLVPPTSSPVREVKQEEEKDDEYIQNNSL